MSTETSNNPNRPAPLPVLITLVLLYGGSSQLVQVPGKKRRYPFVRKNGLGPKGAPAHIREYADLATFQQEEEDIRSTRLQLVIVTRMGEADRFESARSAIARVIEDPVGGPVRLRERLGSLHAIMAPHLPPPSQPEAETSETEAAVTASEDEPSVDRMKRKERERELRRMGESDVRDLVKDVYGLEGVKTLENLDGMIAAVLDHEQTLGVFDPPPLKAATAAQAPPPVRAAQAAPPPPAPVPASNPPPPPVPVAPPPATAPSPTAGATTTHNEASLSALPYEEIVKAAAGLGIPRGAKKALIAAILEKQGKK